MDSMIETLHPVFSLLHLSSPSFRFSVTIWTLALTDLSRRLHTSILAYASCSDQVDALIGVINAKLSGLQSLLDGRGGGVEGKVLGRSEQILGEELPTLAKEVARVEAVRVYAGEFWD